MAKLLDVTLTLAFWSLIFSGVLTVVAGFYVIRTVLGRWWRFQDARAIQLQIDAMRLTPMADLVPGPNLVQVRGQVHAPGQLTAPSGKRCVAYSREQESKMEPFVLRADGDAVWVQSDFFALQGSVDAEARLSPGAVVIVEGRVAELPQDATIPIMAPDVKWQLTEDLGRPLRVLFVDENAAPRMALLAQISRAMVGLGGLLLLFVVLFLGSCLGMVYVLAPHN